MTKANKPIYSISENQLLFLLTFYWLNCVKIILKLVFSYQNQFKAQIFWRFECRSFHSSIRSRGVKHREMPHNFKIGKGLYVNESDSLWISQWPFNFTAKYPKLTEVGCYLFHGITWRTATTYFRLYSSRQLNDKSAIVLRKGVDVKCYHKIVK